MGLKSSAEHVAACNAIRKMQDKLVPATDARDVRKACHINELTRDCQRMDWTLRYPWSCQEIGAASFGHCLRPRKPAAIY